MQGRKWDIFLSAMTLFSLRGYENVTMKDIGAANNMRAASLYNYFSSKEALMNDILLFYVENLEDTNPSLDELIASINNKKPMDVISMAIGQYEEELQPYMDNIFMICLMQSSRDQKAYNLIWKYHFENTEQTLRTLFTEMITRKKILPFDIDSFIDLFSGYIFMAIYRNQSANPLGMDNWQRGLKLLFSLIIENDTE